MLSVFHTRLPPPTSVNKLSIIHSKKGKEVATVELGAAAVTRRRDQLEEQHNMDQACRDLHSPLKPAVERAIKV